MATGPIKDASAGNGRRASNGRSWARWNDCHGQRYTLGVEEEVLLLDASDRSLAQASERVLARLSAELSAHTSPETHAAVVELKTGIHVGVPDPEDAVRVLNGLGRAVPLMLVLSANSPFCQGCDSGFASLRTMIFQGFPRTGTARRFESYADYVGAVDSLIGPKALPDPSFLWWDVRLQPALGTVEVRVMDAQSTIADAAALVALIQGLVRLELEGEPADPAVAPEALAENRFLAARDGLDAHLIDSDEGRLVPARELLAGLLTRCRTHAGSVGSVELDRLGRLVIANGADRQRAWAQADGLEELMSKLTERFAPPSLNGRGLTVTKGRMRYRPISPR